MTGLRSGSATDVGRRRDLNQDMVLEAGTIFAIADGMGGHKGGEVASLTAVEALRAAFDREAGAAGLESAIAAANEAVADKSASTPDLRGMGTTLAVVALVDDGDGDLLVVGNIGDSRIYLLRNGELSQLTDDHSLPQELFRQGRLTEAEAAVDPRRNVVTRVLGPSFGEGPDMQNLVPYAGDRIVLCSDGLYNEVTDDDIAHVLRTISDPKQAARRLVDQANDNGGGDNISVIVVDVVDDDGQAVTASAVLADEDPSGRTSGLMTADQRNAELRQLARDGSGGADADHGAASSRSLGGRTDLWGHEEEIDVHAEPTRRLTGRVVAFVLVLLLVLGGAAAAVGFYARGSYFVGLEDDTVAIFKGRPGGLLWFSPTVEERTDLTESSVPPARADDVRQGHVVTSLDEARTYVENLRASSTTTGAGSAPPVTEPTATPTAPPTSTP
ncbi:MAG TPA: protein phosphatase 2C domain-containing protein [Acidimicrobiales bacterium]|nr:protein phosphatase 2C domain-containing protein [Acidimicrobiales bacterium]